MRNAFDGVSGFHRRDLLRSHAQAQIALRARLHRSNVTVGHFSAAIAERRFANAFDRGSYPVGKVSRRLTREGDGSRFRCNGDGDCDVAVSVAIDYC